MNRLIPAILNAWREDERSLGLVALGSQAAARLTERADGLQRAYSMATQPDADRAAVIRFLASLGLDDVVAAAGYGASAWVSDGGGEPERIGA